MRPAFAEELRNLPALGENLRTVMDAQRERVQLQRQRARVAGDTGRPSAEVLAEFHDLLRKEESLTQRQREALRQMVADADRISSEVESRRREIAARLGELRVPGASPGPLERVEIRKLEGFEQFYRRLGERLATMDENADPEQTLRGLMRGDLDGGEMNSQVAAGARREVQELRQQQDELKRRMADLDGRIGELEDLLNAASRPRRGPRPDAAPPEGMRPDAMPPDAAAPPRPVD